MNRRQRRLMDRNSNKLFKKIQKETLDKLKKENPDMDFSKETIEKFNKFLTGKDGQQ